MADTRSFVGGNYFFYLQGVKCGFLKSVDGGGVSAEVIKEPSGSTYYVKKHIGGPVYEDFEVAVGFSMKKDVFQWIEESWKMNYSRKDGSIAACDYKLEAQSEHEFFHALITETTIPACDGGPAKDPSYITVKFAPEYTRFKKASGKLDPTTKSQQKIWMPNNFKLEIDGLDCTRVNRIEPFTVKQTTVKDDLGDGRDYAQEPGKLEFPNLKISLSDVTSHSWREWHESFVIKGNNGETDEKKGKLTFLTPNRQGELGSITFHNLGIFKLADQKGDAGHDRIKRVTAELYCERMELNYGGKA